MILGNVDFPSSLVDAATNGKLVIFAGAGVSMGAPANLPSFEMLAKDIASGFGREPKKPLDQFIGSLSSDESVLQKATITALQKIDSEPKDLHKHLLGIFSASDKVRIVTTNFDPLFTAASGLLWPEQPEVFTAPALPLGYDFEGLVHLHGANTHPKSIVITDRGFGKAYLADGWASRFLMQMFEAYTVLFVGYSHDDMVMSYLARALPDKAKGKRFALLGENQRSEKPKWQSFGIEPIYFPQTNEKCFVNLDVCTKQLAEFISRQPRDWQVHLTQIAEQDGPQDLEAEHAIQYALKDVSKIRHFTSKATSTKWVFWLYEQKALSPIFRSEVLDDVSEVLESWLLNNFVCTEPDVLFELISREHYRVGNRLWYNLVRKIRYNENVKKIENWIDLLLQLCPHRPFTHGLYCLAEQADKLGMKHHLVCLFFELAKGHVRLKDMGHFTESDQASKWQAELELLTPEWDLNEVWQKHLSPHLIELHKEVLIRGAALLKDRFEANNAWKSKDSKWCSDSFSRSAIEQHEQDNLRTAFDVVIDAMRDSLEVAIQYDDAWVLRWCDEYKISGIALIRRLAVYAVGLNMSLNASAKLGWILEFGIHDMPLRHEVFMLIQKSYPDLTDAERRQLIDEVLAYQGQSELLDDETQAWEHWQWLYVLRRAAEDCPLLVGEMNTLKSKYPKLKHREYPDLHMYSSNESFAFSSPWSVAELLSKNSPDWFEEIKQFKTDEMHGLDRRELHSSVQDAAKEQPDWALDFCEFLIDSDDWQNMLLPYLLVSFEGWPNDENLAKRLTVILMMPEIYTHHSRAVVRVLTGYLRAEQFDIGSDCHQKANQVIKAVWEECNVPDLPISDESRNWLDQAINTLEGDIAMYWIMALDHAVKSDIEAQHTPYLEELVQLIDVENPKTVYSATLICRQINFLYSVDAQWTVDNVLPLFGNESNRVKQAWHGGLACGGIRAAVFANFRPYFENMRDKFEVTLPGKEDLFIEHYVAVGMWHIEDFHISWIPQILGGTSFGRRPYIAQKLVHFFTKGSVETQANIWERNFKPYWKHRIAGVPFLFDAKEAGAMLSLLSESPERFDEAVELAVQMPAPELRRINLIFTLTKLTWIEKYSSSLAKLISYMMKAKNFSSQSYGLDDLLTQIDIDDVEKESFDELNEALIVAGYNSI
jgi:hypothetical protein